MLLKESGQGEKLGQLLPGGDDVEGVRLAGQALDREGETVKPLAVVLVGEGGFLCRRAPQLEKVACLIHMYVHLIGSPGLFRRRLTLQPMRRGREI